MLRPPCWPPYLMAIPQATMLANRRNLDMFEFERLVVLARLSNEMLASPKLRGEAPESYAVAPSLAALCRHFRSP